MPSRPTVGAGPMQRAASGPLPTFLILGAMRSGTTSLHHYLRDHPQVAMGAGKEVHFFDRHFDRGIDWYRSQFPDAGAAAVGEATQTYLYDTQALDRIAATLPDAKLVVILREPVARAHSHYLLNRRNGVESLSFRDAVAAEPARRAESVASARRYSYVDRGKYLEQLERVCERFPRSSLHVMIFEDLRTDPAGQFRPLCRFLGIDDGHLPSSLGTVANEYTEYRSVALQRRIRRLRPELVSRVIGRINRRRATPPPLDPQLAAELAEEFARANTALEEWLGRELPAWRW